MKKELTELVFILDKSGSMAGLEKHTIGGYNSMLEKQKALEGDCKITTVLFDSDYQVIHDRVDLKGLKAMTDKEYVVGGYTALLDAIGRSISKIISVQKNTIKEYRADKVMFVIITDGEENASREHSVEKIRTMIEKQKSDYNWEFIFLGANIDSVETAGNLGIDASRAVDYIADSEGTELNYRVMSEVVARYRQNGEFAEGEFDEIKKRKV